VVVKRIAGCSATLCALLLVSTISCASETEDCRIGSYRLNDGSLVDIAPADGNALRWRRLEGTTGALHSTANGQWRSTYGWTDRADGKVFHSQRAVPGRSISMASVAIASRSM
jgi:hypothetical protein